MEVIIMETILTKNKKDKIKDSELGFGQMFTDHMFMMKYTEGKGWYDKQICPYQNFSLDPSTTVFHYGQAVFEGMKAYKNEQGEIRLFRPLENFKRINKSCDRLCMPHVDCEEMLECLKALLEVEKDWIPTSVGTSLYIRPFMIATDATLGVHASHNYIFAIILSPSGSYYKNGLKPVNIYVEDEYVRSVKGGTGAAKAAGNYAASIIAGNKAKSKGYDQVLWLDGRTGKYVEEVGTMNIFFVQGKKVITPMLTGSILPGITRDSVITLCKSFGLEVEERMIEIEEIMNMKDLTECFGTGTAAVISHVGKLHYMGKELVINNMEMGEITNKIYKTLTDLQLTGKDDSFNWSIKL